VSGQIESRCFSRLYALWRADFAFSAPSRAANASLNSSTAGKFRVLNPSGSKTTLLRYALMHTSTQGFLALAAFLLSAQDVRCVSLHGLAAPWRQGRTSDLSSEFSQLPNPVSALRVRAEGAQPIALLAKAAATVSTAAASALDFNKVWKFRAQQAEHLPNDTCMYSTQNFSWLAAFVRLLRTLSQHHWMLSKQECR
jgi:hypothetical protein